MTNLSQRFTEAVDYARIAHAKQVRKGSGIPYLYHLLGVASLVLEYGGTEDQAIAGLLHDVLEDCGAEHEEAIRAKFGDTVADIVKDCTDGTAETKAAATTPEAKREDWRLRKLSYLKHLAHESDLSLLVGGCDKLHNARAILIDLERPDPGVTVFNRFTGGRDGTLQYYASIAEILATRNTPMAGEFERIVDRIHALAGATTRRALDE